MAKIDDILNEKFGFTKDLLPNKQPTPARMHDYVTDRNGRGSYTAGGHPMEKYRQYIKTMLNAVDTETESILENAVDWIALKRLANKHGLSKSIINSIDTIQLELENKSPDLTKVVEEFEKIKNDIPYWFLGMAGTDYPNTPRKLEEEEKEALTNLRDIMDKVSEVSGKEFERANKNGPVSTTDTNAKKVLDDFRSKRDVEKTENLDKKPDYETGT